MGWPSMQMITFMTWKLLLFLLCSAFGMKSMKAFQQSQYQLPWWEIPSKGPFCWCCKAEHSSGYKETWPNLGTASTDTTSNWPIVPLRSSDANLGRWWECWCVNHQSTYPPPLLAGSVDNFCSGYRSAHHVQCREVYPGRKKIMNSTQRSNKLNCLDNLRLFLLRKSIWLEAGKLPTLPAEWGWRATEKPIWMTKTVSFPFFFACITFF